MFHSLPAYSAGSATDSADWRSHDGRYADRVQDIVNLCHNNIEHRRERFLKTTTEDTDEMKQAVLHWGQAVLSPTSLKRIESKAHSPIDHRLEALAREVAHLEVGEIVRWPVSA